MSVYNVALLCWSDPMLVSSARTHNSLRFSRPPSTAHAIPTHRQPPNYHLEQESK